MHEARARRHGTKPHGAMLERQYRQLNDEELGSAQRHLASSEQALQAARAGCDVRSERWTTNSRVVGHTLYDQPLHRSTPRQIDSSHRSTPRSLTRDAINSRRTPPIGAHPINDLTQNQKGACLSTRRPKQLIQAAPPGSPSRRGSSPSWRGSSPSRPPPVMVPFTPVSSCSADVPLLPPSRREAHFYTSTTLHPATATAPASALPLTLTPTLTGRLGGGTPQHASNEELDAVRGLDGARARAAAAAGRFALAARAVEQQAEAETMVAAAGAAAASLTLPFGSSGGASGVYAGLRSHRLSELEKGGADAVRAAFQRFDVNRSGRLDYRELREALRTLGIDYTSSQAARVLQAYDADASGLMELREFRSLVRHLGQAGRAAGDKPCCEGCMRTTRALLAGALCFVAGYALAVALHDGQWGAALCGALGLETPKFSNPGSPMLRALEH